MINKNIDCYGCDKKIKEEEKFIVCYRGKETPLIAYYCNECYEVVKEQKKDLEDVGFELLIQENND